MFFLFLLVADGLGVDELGLLLVTSVDIPSHFVLNLVQDELGLLVDVGREVLVVHFQLVWVRKDEFLKREGVVELVAVVDPTLRNYWYLFVEELLQFCLLLCVVLPCRDFGGCSGWRRDRGGILRDWYDLRLFGLLDEVVGPDD
jgi:hypothetical protein